MQKSFFTDYKNRNSVSKEKFFEYVFYNVRKQFQLNSAKTSKTNISEEHFQSKKICLYSTFRTFRVATGDYFFITLNTSFFVKFYLTWKTPKKKRRLFLFWKSGSQNNKKIVACGNPEHLIALMHLNKFESVSISIDKKKAHNT